MQSANKNIFKTKKGFSLIELLIVIAILGIISSVGILGFSTAQKRTRDANRKSDLAQYRTSLEAYANRNNGLYPVHSSTVSADSICRASELNLPSCALDPKSGTSPYGYRYRSDASGATYIVYGILEAPSPAANIYFGLCSTGATVSQQNAPSVSNCQ